MATVRRLAIRIAGHPTLAVAAAEHLALAALVDIIAVALHAPTGLRMALMFACLAGHWHVHVRRH